MIPTYDLQANPHEVEWKLLLTDPPLSCTLPKSPRRLQRLVGGMFKRPKMGRKALHSQNRF